jgi:hypothetical protein
MWYATTPGEAGWVNEGHPVPESNFSSESKITVPQQRQA